MIKRLLSGNIKKLSVKMPVISIIGPRQSGKTTLVRDVFRRYNYVNLELLENRNMAEKDPHGFIKFHLERGVIIDEVQNVPDLFSYIQVYADEIKKNGKFILTGSQNFLMLEKITQSLAGRVCIKWLLPFSFRELQKIVDTGMETEQYMINGFYPGVYDRKLDPDDFYPGYISTYVERDVRKIVNIGDLRSFQEFLKLCAGRAGQLLNLHAIGNAIGVDHKTIKRWISILEASFIIFLVPRYYKNFNKRVVKSPKLYFYDTGLLCSLLNIKDSKQLFNHFFYGALFENLVMAEIIKAYYNQGKSPSIYFWQDYTGNEIDCILEEGQTLKLIEIKSTRTFQTHLCKNLNYFDSLKTHSQVEKHLIYNGERSFIFKDIHITRWQDTDKKVIKTRYNKD